MKKNKFRVERTEGDDILDALSLRINQDLRTEKQIDDKKNNVYFWLFKFLILIVYILVVNALFVAVKELGVSLIYLFAVSLRSVLSFVFKTGITFIQFLFTTYVLLKNLKIFTDSTYYKRLYAKDRYMLKRKRRFFGIIENVLKAFGIVHLVFIGFIAIFLISILTMLATLAFNGLYMLSLTAIAIILLIMCFLVFEEIKSKFFGYKSKIRKEHLYVGLLALIFALVCFGYETNSYKVNSSLPENMETVTQSFNITLPNIEKVYISSNAKFNNMELKVDESLNNEVRIEVEYYETARVSYVSYFNTNNNLELRFDGETQFELKNLEDVFKLGVETIRNKTMYNYNMFKYPKIRVYCGMSDYDRIILESKLEKIAF
jgi:hypothetical protein